MSVNKSQKNDMGFSIVELIVVIAIGAVLLSAMVYSISFLTGREAQKCANNISIALDKAKTYGMTKSGKRSAYLEISYDANEGYIATYFIPDNPIKPGGFIEEKEIIGNKSVEVSFDGTAINEGNKLKISYDRMNGALVDSCNKITVTRGRTYEITLVQMTGKHTIDRVS